MNRYPASCLEKKKNTYRANNGGKILLCSESSFGRMLSVQFSLALCEHYNNESNFEAVTPLFID